MKNNAWIGGVFGFLISFSTAEEVIEVEKIEISGIVDQRDFSKMGCTLASIMNSVKFGSDPARTYYRNLAGSSTREKAATLVKAFGKKRSVGANGVRWASHRGMMEGDVLGFYEDLVKEAEISPQLTGYYLNLQSGESGVDQLQRVHEAMATSIELGIPPVVILRSFATSPQDEGTSATARPYWEHHISHAITIVEVPKSLGKDSGFAFEYLDSWGGRKCSGYLYVERHRSYAAMKGRPSRSQWLTGKPFLLVTVPDTWVGQDKIKFYQRMVITANYGVFGRENAEKEQEP